MAALPSGDLTLEQYLADAIRSLRYGALEITVHDGRVVQVERREKLRVNAVGRPAGVNGTPDRHD